MTGQLLMALAVALGVVLGGEIARQDNRGRLIGAVLLLVVILLATRVL